MRRKGEMMDIEIEIVGKEKNPEVLIVDLPVNTVFQFSSGRIGLKMHESRLSLVLCDEGGFPRSFYVDSRTTDKAKKVLGKLVGIKVEEIE